MKNPVVLATALFKPARSIPFLMLLGALNAWGQSSEPFSYPAGSLAAQNGGSGWLGAWTTPPTATTPPVIATGLAYPNLVTSGGAVSDTSGTSYAATRQWFDPAVAFANGSTIWFSCLLRYNVSHNSDILLLPFGKSSTTSDGFGVAINTRATANASTWGNDPYVFLRGGTTNYGMGGSSSGMGLIATIGLGKPVFVVGRFTLSTTANSDALDIWVNQTQEPITNSVLRKTGLAVYRSTGNSGGQPPFPPPPVRSPALSTAFTPKAIS